MSGVIDAHSHIYPRAYIDLLKSRREIPRIDERDGSLFFVIFPKEEKTGGRRVEPKTWSIEEKLAFMDQGGFDRSVISLGNPWLDPVTGAESIDWAHRINEDLAQIASASRGRLHALGVLPNARPAEAAEVARRVAATENLRGVITGCRIGGRALDDPELDPLWSVLSESGLPVFVHPHYAVAIDQLEGFGNVLPLAIGFPVETSIAVARFILAGGLQRYPGVRILVAHAGGVLPYLAARLDVAWRADATAQQRLPVPPGEELAKLWLDAVAYHPRALRAAIDLVGGDRVLFGTDHPFFKERPQDVLSTVAATFRSEDPAIRAITTANAIKFFGL